MKVCYVITQRGERKYWNRIGVAFVNSDGSINVKLESLPVSGDFQIRDYSSPSEYRELRDKRELNPDAGHGAGDGQGGTDYPF
jgi:hypothetical protein